MPEANRLAPSGALRDYGVDANKGNAETGCLGLVTGFSDS
jgi:hypothetical protein